MVREKARREAVGDRAARGLVEVADADEIDLVERPVLLGVKATEVADANNRRAELAHARATPRSDVFTKLTKCAICGLGAQ